MIFPSREYTLLSIVYHNSTRFLKKRHFCFYHPLLYIIFSIKSIKNVNNIRFILKKEKVSYQSKIRFSLIIKRKVHFSMTNGFYFPHFLHIFNRKITIFFDNPITSFENGSTMATKIEKKVVYE